MNTTVIEAQARYLIEDRIHPDPTVSSSPAACAVGPGRSAS